VLLVGRRRPCNMGSHIKMRHPCDDGHLACPVARHDELNSVTSENVAGTLVRSTPPTPVPGASAVCHVGGFSLVPCRGPRRYSFSSNSFSAYVVLVAAHHHVTRPWRFSTVDIWSSSSIAGASQSLLLVFPSAESTQSWTVCRPIACLRKSRNAVPRSIRGASTFRGCRRLGHLPFARPFAGVSAV